MPIESMVTVTEHGQRGASGLDIEYLLFVIAINDFPGTEPVRRPRGARRAGS